MHKHEAETPDPRGSLGGGGSFVRANGTFLFVESVDLFDSGSRCGLLDCVKPDNWISECLFSQVDKSWGGGGCVRKNAGLSTSQAQIGKSCRTTVVEAALISLICSKIERKIKGGHFNDQALLFSHLLNTELPFSVSLFCPPTGSVHPCCHWLHRQFPGSHTRSHFLAPAE